MEILLSDQPILHPYSITFFDSNIYWTDWSKKAIFKMTLKNMSFSTIRENLDNIRDIHAYDQDRQPKGN